MSGVQLKERERKKWRLALEGVSVILEDHNTRNKLKIFVPIEKFVRTLYNLIYFWTTFFPNLE